MTNQNKNKRNEGRWQNLRRVAVSTSDVAERPSALINVSITIKHEGKTDIIILFSYRHAEGGTVEEPSKGHRVSVGRHGEALSSARLVVLIRQSQLQNMSIKTHQ